MIFQTGENRAISQNEVLLFHYIRFPPVLPPTIPVRLAAIALCAKLPVLIKPLNYLFCLTEICQEMCCGSVEWILAVKSHVSPSQKCDFYYHYHAHIKNLGNEPFHFSLPTSAAKAKRDPLGMRASEVHSALLEYRCACLQDSRYWMCTLLCGQETNP